MPITRVMLGNNCVHLVMVLPMLTSLSISGWSIGIRAWPKAMRRAWTAAPNCCHGSTMAAAIFSACSKPRTLPSWSMPPLSRSVSWASAPITWAPSPPNASTSLLSAAALRRSPNLPCSLAMMSSIGRTLPLVSVNLRPSFSEALPIFSKNAL
ncbi:hypothetical protein D3C76_1165880 [compost metagenome]